VQHDKTQALTESAIAEYGGVSEMPSGFNPIKALQTVAVRKSPNPERTPIWTPNPVTGIVRRGRRKGGEHSHQNR
jgi:hypothetical protein